MSADDGVHLRADALLALRAFSTDLGREGESHPSHSGGIAGRRRGAGHDFYDLRPYEPGDDPRHLDAAATARSGRRQIRRFHEEVDQTALLVVDFRSPMFWGTKTRLRSVAAAMALAILGWRHVDQLAKIGLVIITDDDLHHIAPAPRDAHMMTLIAQLEAQHHLALERADLSAKTMPLDQALEHIRTLSRQGGMIEFATGLDHMGAHFRSSFEHLAQRSRLRLLVTLDACQIDPPRGIWPLRARGHTHLGRLGTWQTPDALDALPIEQIALNAALEPDDWSKELAREP